jgi:hypothetical protein
MSTAQEWLEKAGTRVEGGKGLYEGEDPWVDRLALHTMESWLQTTGLSCMGLSILLGRISWVCKPAVLGNPGEVMPESMRDPKEPLTVVIDRSGVDGRKNKSKPIRGEGSSEQKLSSRRLPHTPLPNPLQSLL